ncbi:deoxyribonuclease-1-like [Anneissia japonica]|uniref:deoxyribonuclease-1-like n=1 Tax=Anneissia japonica TaxID=1529436 RepID=UPI0014254DE5|nr:deoxyribonuclease-1-like [Anneissia japonica]
MSKLLYLALLVILVSNCLGDLRFSAFNIQTFGVSKMDKPEVVDTLVDIILRYDLVLIQEIRDSSGKSIIELLNEVNEHSSCDPYALEIGARAGRSSYKEQYAFIYKRSKLSVSDKYEYDDGPEGYTPAIDEFIREPFVVRFSSPETCVKDFAVVPIHTSPDFAEAEVDSLTDVYDDVVAKWGIEDVIIAGDFNADCSYITSSEWDSIRLRTQTRFDWLIGDDVDTTVSSTDCAYDRFVIAGSNMKASYTRRSAGTFNFDTFYGLSESEAKAVSDHYPIEMTLKSSC